MANPLPDPSSLRGGLLDLLAALDDFEQARADVTFSASSSDGAVSATVDGVGYVVTLAIAPSQLALGPVVLANKVKDTVNSALDAAYASTSALASGLASGLSLPGLPPSESPLPDFEGFGFAARVHQLVTQIEVNNPCETPGVFTCRKGNVVAVVDARRRVVSLTLEEPLPEILKQLETQIIRALNCAIEDGTDRPDDTDDITPGIICSLGLHQLVLYAKGELKLNDRVRVKRLNCTDWATIANAGTADSGNLETSVGVEADVGKIASRPRVFVRDRGRVHGMIATGDVLETQNQTEIDGPVTEGAALILPDLEIGIPFPGSTQGTIELEPGQQQTAAPGYYTKLHPKQNAQVFLSSGVYYFDEVLLEPDSKVWLDANQGPIFLWVKSAFTYRGAFLDSAGEMPRLFIGYLGTSMAVVERSLRATLAAPNAKISISTVQSHEGAFHGKHIEVQPDIEICHRPFELRYDQVPGLEPPGAPEPPTPPVAVDSLLSFEDPSLWTSPQLSLGSSTTHKTHLERAVEVTTAPGWLQIVSSPFSSQGLSASQGKVRIDLRASSNQPNQWWHGQLHLAFDVPSLGIQDAGTSPIELTPLAKDTFHDLEFTLPTSVRDAINGSHPDIVIKAVLNVFPGSGPYHLDRIRFL